MKWRERQEKEKREAVEALKALESSAPAPSRDPWIARSIAIVVVACWMAGLAIYYVRRLSELKPVSRSSGGRGSGLSGSAPAAP